ncbi:hypothetical protein [Paraburkholderia sp. Ac-20347]|uniref:hypothetical protein n=1 Tax=Paraburkholderia sp. Ac-20347 TaxID=2703892 RepID=UPI00198092BA|nr:hypothetical protein [Paraburkholderia sp. Ac-20347]MBN3807831.1 hypothetical protein [Paraburkholderia sp. Ac-20347]
MPTFYFGQITLIAELRQNNVATLTVTKGNNAVNAIGGTSRNSKNRDIKVELEIPYSTRATFNGTLEFDDKTGGKRPDYEAFIKNASTSPALWDFRDLLVDSSAPSAHAEISIMKIEFRGQCPGDTWRDPTIGMNFNGTLPFTVA